MKKIITILLSILIITSNSLPLTVYATTSPPSITAPSGILMDADTGAILYEKNIHEQMYPASTTKIMTAILTLEYGNLNDVVTIDNKTPFTDGSRIYLMEGEQLTVEQLLYSLLIESANDSAVALAKYVSGSVDEFTKLMNKRAKELGALHTNFENPNGLPNENHVTTAYDLAMIGKHAMTITKLREIVKTVRYEIPPTNKQTITRYFKNHNRFVSGTSSRDKMDYNGKTINIKYDIIDGIKTGYTNIARQCLVTSAMKDGHRLISVVLKTEGKNVYSDSRTLIDYGFENFKFIKLVDANKKIKTVEIQEGTLPTIDLVTKNELYKAVSKENANLPLEKTVEINKEIKAPIKKGDVLGKILYKVSSTNFGEIELIASQSVPIKEKSFLVKIFNGKNFLRFVLFLIFVFLAWRSIVTFFRFKRSNMKQLRKKKYHKKHTKYDFSKKSMDLKYKNFKK
ncbi:D-alanyl-D-alanine carboxypeptidase [Lutibacter sp. B2]|nr:D-alanyl-D-alanine carboxypeptidase [Lutibacter sp. B2]